MQLSREHALKRYNRASFWAVPALYACGFYGLVLLFRRVGDVPPSGYVVLGIIFGALAIVLVSLVTGIIEEDGGPQHQFAGYGTRATLSFGLLIAASALSFGWFWLSQGEATGLLWFSLFRLAWNDESDPITSVRKTHKAKQPVS